MRDFVEEVFQEKAEIVLVSYRNSSFSTWAALASRAQALLNACSARALILVFWNAEHDQRPFRRTRVKV